MIDKTLINIMKTSMDRSDTFYKGRNWGDPGLKGIYKPLCRIVLSVSMLCSFVASSFSQTTTITGRITNEMGEGIPGANIVVKGTTMGTAADLEGRYTIEVGEGTAKILSISSVGYNAEEVVVDGRSVVDFQLATNFTELSEIVITGTGVPTEKKKLAFAVETLSSEEIPLVPTSSLDQALVGRIAGAQISTINGTPGSEVSILLRGINTINRGTMPIILMDGVQMGATLLSSIDPNSIERVEVVQGAAAATIYGAQGANGVIQLFSKRGQGGKVNIDFSFSAASSEFLNVGGLRKAQLHAFSTNGNNEVIGPGSGIPLSQNDTTLLYNGDVGYNPFDPSVKTDKPYDQNLRYLDHFEMFFKPALTYSSRIGVSGLSGKTDYNVAVSNVRQQSSFKGDGYNDRTNLTLNLGTEIVRGLRLRSVTQLIYNHSTINIWGKQDFGKNGNLLFMLTSRFNPFYEFQYASSRDKKVDILQSLNLTYSFPKYVEIDVLYGLNYQMRNFRHEVQNQSLNQNSTVGNHWTLWYNSVDNTGEITVFDNDRIFQNLKVNAVLNLDFEKDLGMSIPVRSTTQFTYDYRGDQLNRYTSYALGMPLVPPLSSSFGTTFNVPEDYKEEFVTFGYLVNQRFELGEVAGVSVGFRSDYSSAFGEGSKPFTFPRADGYFRLSSMGFWDNSSISRVIFDWKLRAAYGQAGIQPRPFDRYVSLRRRALGSTSALYFPSTQSNPDLNVEVSEEFEAGTDIVLEGLKGNWLRNFQLSFSYWTRGTENAIFRVDAPPTSGAGTVLNNAVSLESNGVQGSLLASLYRSSKWSWNLTTNFSKQRSIFTHVTGDEIIFFSRILKAGEPVGQYYGWLMLNSVDQKRPDGESFIDPSQQDNFEVASNGWVVDRNTKQPFITPDRHSLGNPNPDFMMTFISDFSYNKWLTFSLQLDWLSGNHVYNFTKQNMYGAGVHSDYEVPITINGESGAWTSFYRGAFNDTYYQKNYFVEDASFLRLRNVSIGVDFVPLLSIKKINKLQLVLSGRNVWTRTKYTGMDPEVNMHGVNDYYNNANTITRGNDEGTPPNLRTYQFTLLIGI
jgi:TonB-dependent starch-binding outer membrane protein SusC